MVILVLLKNLKLLKSEILRLIKKWVLKLLNTVFYSSIVTFLTGFLWIDLHAKVLSTVLFNCRFILTLRGSQRLAKGAKGNRIRFRR